MTRKKRKENSRAGSKFKLIGFRVLSFVRNLFKPAKARAKSHFNEAMDTHPDAPVGALPKDTTDLPAGEEASHRSLLDNSAVIVPSLIGSPDPLAPQDSAIVSTSLPNQYQDTDLSATASQVASAHQSNPSLATSQVALAHPNSITTSTIVPAEHMGSLPLTNYSSISTPDLLASSRQSHTNITVLSIGEQKQPSFNPLPNQTDAPAPETASKSSTVMTVGIAFLKTLGTILSFPTERIEKVMSGNKTVGEYCNNLSELIKASMGPKSNIPNDSLETLRSDLDQIAEETSISDEGAWWRATNRLQIFLLEVIVTLPEVFGKHILDKEKDEALHQAVMNLPCAKAAYNDYTSEKRRRVSCFEGTRQALLNEIILWAAESASNVYVLFGLAGIGKSTIAQTVAEKVDRILLLGASFFFSRDEEKRSNAEMFFTTIAFQLCVYHADFATAIESVLQTKKGKGAMTKDPLEQLQTLILEPLQNVAPRKVVIVVDALDECDEDDALKVLNGLQKLVQTLPLFKILLTTRPQSHFNSLDGDGPHKVFHLHHIEDKVVDDDIRLYLKHNLSRKAVQDHFRDSKEEWNASDDEINSLVKAAGRLFIVASSSVLYILDKDAQDPKLRMKRLLEAIARDETPLDTLDKLYSVILQGIIPKDRNSDTRKHYQIVVGAIMLIRTPLSVDVLAKLINVELKRLRIVLRKLQPVILIDDTTNTPRIYHKSFRDYIQDPERCRDEYLRIEPKSHNTQMALHCFTMMTRLKPNILDLVGPARFLDNDKQQGLAIEEKIPLELRYACLQFAKHIESANVEDAKVMEGLKTFINERLLYWIEALSWIDKLDSAYNILFIIQKLLRPSSSDLRDLVADIIRFIAKFYASIKRSALHTYHSALPFTPTETGLRKKYSKQKMFCQVQGGQKKWGALVAQKDSNSSNPVNDITFSPDGTLFACYAKEVGSENGLATIYDAAVAVPVRWVKGQSITITKDFSKAAHCDARCISLTVVEGVKHMTSIEPFATVVCLGLFLDGSRLVAGLDDGTVNLWDANTRTLIKRFYGWQKRGGVAFSTDSNRIAFASQDAIVLLDGTSGEMVHGFPLSGQKVSSLMFSGDGSLLACLANSTLEVWNSQDGESVGTAKHAGNLLAISIDGSLLATGTIPSPTEGAELTLWTGDNFSHTEKLHLGGQLAFGTLDLETLDFEFHGWSVAIQGGILGVALFHYSAVILYDVNRLAFITRLPFFAPTSLAFSPDGKRLAIGNIYSEVQLWDILSITTSNATSEGQTSTPIELAFSPNCSRIASVHQDGIIRLWDTSDITQPIAVRKCDTKAVAFAFSVDDENFASWSAEGNIQVWNGATPNNPLICSDQPTALALSSNILAAATKASITLWDLKTGAIGTLDQGDARLLTLPDHHHLLAIATDNTGSSHSQHSLKLWDLRQGAVIATVDLGHSTIKSMVQTPDRSRLALLYCDNLRLFSIQDKKVSEIREIGWSDFRPHWQGISVTGRQHGIVGVFQQHHVTVLYFPSDLDTAMVADGSSLIAIGSSDGHILLVKVV